MTEGVAAPRFMTDHELRSFFGLSERALQRLRLTGRFPKKDGLVNKTDRKLVSLFFDHRSGIEIVRPVFAKDGEENFDDARKPAARRGRPRI